MLLRSNCGLAAHESSIPDRVSGSFDRMSASKDGRWWATVHPRLERLSGRSWMDSCDPSVTSSAVKMALNHDTSKFRYVGGGGG